jgi:hypothetical protein
MVCRCGVFTVKEKGVLCAYDYVTSLADERNMNMEL